MSAKVPGRDAEEVNMTTHKGTKAKGGKEYGRKARKAEGKGLRKKAKQALKKER